MGPGPGLPSLPLRCSKCGNTIIPLDQCVMYQKGEKEVHLIIRPELYKMVVDRGKLVEKKSDGKKGGSDIFCPVPACGQKLGKLLPFGPSNATFVGFGTEKVMVDKLRFTVKDKWRELWPNGHLCGLLRGRTDVDFFGEEVKEGLEEPIQRSVGIEVPPLKLPESQEDFSWDGLITSDIQPRDYQVNAFVWSLVCDSIVVMPTGAGKTLVSALFLARMRELNPERLAFMVVDRVPLVFQQARAISSHTGMRALRLCSENKTKKAIEQLMERTGRYDYVVVTAGLLRNLVENGDVPVSLMSCLVLDECHHAFGGHVYSWLLDQVARCRGRPRLLGLSASPVPAKSLPEAIKALSDMKGRFLGAQIIRPPLPPSHQTVRYIDVDKDYAQTDFHEMVCNEMRRIIHQLGGLKGDAVAKWNSWVSDEMHKGRWTQLRGEARSLLDNTRNEGLVDVHEADSDIEVGPPPESQVVSLTKELLVWLASIELCWLLGVSEAEEHLSKAGFSALRRSGRNHISPRLQCLEKTLKDRVGGGVRALVFVDTRDLAAQLHKWLAANLPVKVERVVGHTGMDGMLWQEQGEVLGRFRRGDTPVLVCTSVLEEGLDVVDCDLVIQFSVRNRSSLIQHVQCRGRARAKQGEMLVLLTKEEHELVSRIAMEESCLNLALEKEAMTVQRAELKSRVEAVLGRLPQPIRSPPPIPPIRRLADGPSTIRFYAQSSQSRMADPLEELSVLLGTVLEEKGLGPIEQIEAFSITSDVKSSPVFQGVDSVVLVSLTPQEHLPDPLLSLAALWDFKCGGHSIHCLVSPPTRTDQTKPPPLLPRPGICVRRVNVGHIVGPNAFQESGALRSEIGLLVPTSGVSLTLSGPTVSIVLPLHSLGPLALIAANRGGTKEVTSFLPFTSTPSIKVLVDAMEDKEDRVAVRHHGIPPDLDIGSDEMLEEDLDSAATAAARECAICDLELLATSSALTITCDLEEWEAVCGLFGAQEKTGIPAFITRVLTTTSSHEQPPWTTLIWPDLDLCDPLVMRCLFAFLALATNRVHRSLALSSPSTLRVIWGQMMDSLAHETASPCPLDAILAALQILPNIIPEEAPFADVVGPFSTLVRQLSTTPLGQPPCPEGHILVQRMMVTPSRMVFLGETSVPSSRMLRWCAAQSINIMVVAFRDEQGQMLRDNCMEGRTQDVLDSGLDVCGVHYNFLAASASQSRNHTALFAAASQDIIEAVYAHFIPDWRSLRPFTCLARLGLFCTADIPTNEIPSSQWAILEDEKTLEKGHLLTDGAGLISSELYERVIFSRLRPTVHASAIQLRIAGIKGVLTVVPKKDIQGGKDIMFRESMVKCESPDHMLSVVKEATYAPVRLNRDVLNLLLSHINASKAIQSRVEMLQEEELERLAAMLTRTEDAYASLSGVIANQVDPMKAAGVDPLADGYYRTLLDHVYSFRVRALIEKANIPVKDGAFLMAVPDPYGVLHSNEIFFQISRAGEASSPPSPMVAPRVLIYRNPCLHPGDVRVVKAVDHPGLHHLVNVVVFSVSPSGPSLASDCSGGDLDGDCFSVIWDEGLIPDDVHPALDYKAVLEEARKEQDDKSGEDQPRTMKEAFVRIVVNEAVGRVAHMHLALCDILDDGARDPLAIELAKSQSLAVDYPKTGIPPRVPKEAMDLVKEKGHPDFMAMPNCYRSSKPLGQLYRRCKSIVPDLHLKEDGTRDLPALPILQERCSSEQLDEARAIYRSYCAAVGRLAARFAMRTDYELHFGQPMREIGGDRGAMSRSVGASWQALQKTFRDAFFASEYATDHLAWAAAWYVASHEGYAKKEDGQGDAALPTCLSFAWVVHDVMSKLFQEIGPSLPPTHTPTSDSSSPSLSLAVGVSALQSWLTSQPDMHRLQSSMLEPLRLITAKLEAVLGGKDEVDVKMFGSVALWLSELESDLDLCILPRTLERGIPKEMVADFQAMRLAKRQESWMETVLAPALDDLALEKRVVPATVPVVKVVLNVGDSRVHVDLCLCPDGLHKAQYILRLYQARTWHLPLFSLIMQWARACGLVKQSDRSGIIAAGELHALILVLTGLSMPSDDCPAAHFDGGYMVNVAESKYVALRKKSRSKKKGWPSECKEDAIALGGALFRFFTGGARLRKEVEFVWPVEGKPVHHIKEGAIREVASCCAKALHCLGLSRSWKVLLQTATGTTTTTSRTIRLAPLLSRNLQEASLGFHKARLEFLSGAQITLEADVEGMVSVVANGSPYQLSLVRTELARLKQVGYALAAGRMHYRTAAYFMANSTLLMARGHVSRDVGIKFHPSISFPHQYQHALKEVSFPTIMTAPESGDAWKGAFVSGVCDKVMDQLQRLKNGPLVETLRLAIHIGLFYGVEVGVALESSAGGISLPDLEAAIVANKMERKVAERAEYDKERVDGQRKKVQEKKEQKEREMKELRRGGGNDGAAGGGGGAGGAAAKSHRRKRRNNICCAFWSGISNVEKDMVVAHNGGAEAFVDEVLCRQGFVEDVGPITEAEGCWVWSVQLIPSKSFAVVARFDAAMKMTTVAQRRLNWVHATLLAGQGATLKDDGDDNNSILRAHDVRVKLQTREVVKKDSDLYREIMGKYGKGPLTVDTATGRPESRTPRVMFVRKMDSRRVLRGPLGLMAVISKGVQYEGTNLDGPRPFCELSLETDVQPLRAWVQERQDREAASNWLQDVVHAIVTVSEALRGAGP